MALIRSAGRTGLSLSARLGQYCQVPSRAQRRQPVPRLTHKGAEGNPGEQKRVIVDRLARRATRDGGNASEVATVVRSVLDEYLPG
jgi:hypothetical protein